jgi:hypothetical protein
VAGSSPAPTLPAAETLEMPGNHNDTGASPGTVLADARLAAAALRMHAERMQLGKRERRLAEHFTSAHPAVPVTEVAAQPEDVHDLAGLRIIGELLTRAERGLQAPGGASQFVLVASALKQLAP